MINYDKTTIVFIVDIMGLICYDTGRMIAKLSKMDVLEAQTYSIGEAASLLHLNRKTLQRWARAGKVPAIRLNPDAQRGLYIFEKSALWDWLKSREVDVEKTSRVSIARRDVVPA